MDSMSYASSIILIRLSLVKPFANKVFSFLTFKIPYAILIPASTKSDLWEERDEMQKQPKFRRELLKFNQINKELNDIYDAFMRQEKMSHSEFDILYSLCELGVGCTQHDICSVSWLPKQTVNSSIRKLEQKGLIKLLPGRGRELRPKREKNGSGRKYIRLSKRKIMRLPYWKRMNVRRCYRHLQNIGMKCGKICWITSEHKIRKE